MLASTYDPNAISSDTFLMSNMVEDTDAKILTAAERSIIASTSGTNTGDQDLTPYQLKPSEGAFVDGDKTALDANTAARHAAVTLGGTGTYISIAGQVITVDPLTESDISDLGVYIENITGEPLSDLSDVTITTIASGEILKWNGTAWINQTLAEAGIATAAQGTRADEASDMLSTGLISGGNLTINGVDNSKFDVSAGSGIIVDSSTAADCNGGFVGRVYVPDPH